MTTKKFYETNPDYSKSAVKLTNPPEVRNLLGRLAGAQAVMRRLTQDIEDAIPIEYRQSRDNIAREIADYTQAIKSFVLLEGGYQDVVNGHYALQQYRQSWEWKPEALRQHYPKWAVQLIVEVVDAEAAKAQIGKGLGDEQMLKDHGVIVAGKGTTAWIIRTGQEVK